MQTMFHIRYWLVFRFYDHPACLGPPSPHTGTTVRNSNFKCLEKKLISGCCVPGLGPGVKRKAHSRGFGSLKISFRVRIIAPVFPRKSGVNWKVTHTHTVVGWREGNRYSVGDNCALSFVCAAGSKRLTDILRVCGRPLKTGIHTARRTYNKCVRVCVCVCEQRCVPINEAFEK